MEHIGKAAYKLKLLDGARVHPAFHYSLLKPFHHSTLDTTSPLPLPATSIKNQSIITPLVVLSTRWNPVSVYPKLQVLVQWEGLSPNDTLWKDWDQLKATYHLEDKMFLEGIGTDRKNAPQVQPGLRERSTRKVTTPGYLKDYV